MILVKDNNFWAFGKQWFKPYYYKNKADQAANKKTWFKYINHIEILQCGYIEIGGKIGRKMFVLYTVKQAIKKYNQLAREV